MTYIRGLAVYVEQIKSYSWWRHQMETFSTLLAICVGNSPVRGEFPAQWPVTLSFDVFFDLRLNKRLRTQLWRWWFVTLWRPLWRNWNVRIKTQTWWLYFPLLHNLCMFIWIIAIKMTSIVITNPGGYHKSGLLLIMESFCLYMNTCYSQNIFQTNPDAYIKCTIMNLDNY